MEQIVINLPNFSNVRIDRRFHDTRSDTQQRVSNEQDMNIPGIVHEDPCYQMGNVDQEGSLLPTDVVNERS